jgi:hypothetical protein
VSQNKGRAVSRSIPEHPPGEEAVVTYLRPLAATAIAGNACSRVSAATVHAKRLTEVHCWNDAVVVVLQAG